MTEAAIHELLVKQQLHELEMAYCRGLDRRDEALLRSVFFEDAVVEHGQMFSGTGGGFAAWAVNEFLLRYEITAHYVLNEWYHVEGECAEAEIYRVTYHRERKDDRELATVAAGRAFNRYECRSGVWKICYRTVVRDWMTQSEAKAAAAAPGFSLAASAPGPEDPSYAVLGMFRGTAGGSTGK
ncbi:MAG: nuclear transport factor 2 family protein [Ramlibacter sp.]